ncbi:MAG TPA: site-2 protease family protein, partial [Urbifossiella sp.]
MRDPMNWALRVFTAFGIPVKIHLFFFIFTLGMFLRQVTPKENPIAVIDVFLFTIVLLFGIVLLHEFGHCFAARFVGGDASEILIWPLGGLASVEAPHAPKPTFIVAAGGPAVNVLICVVCTLGMLAGRFVPNFNPLSNPYVSDIHNYADGRNYTSEYGLKLYKPGSAEPLPQQLLYDAATKAQETGIQDRVVWRPETSRSIAEKAMAEESGERALAPGWAVWLNRIFWLSWLLFLFNLIPAFPLDGGQMLQAIVWDRTDYRRGVVVACYSGFVVAVLFLIVSIWQNEALFMGLALFMLYMASMKLNQLDSEEGPFGYDFSAGYTSLEKDEEPAPKPKQPGAFARWWQSRQAKKQQKAAAQRALDEDRKESLLEKIQVSGMASLTAEE